MVYDPPKAPEPWYCIRCHAYPPSAQLDARTDPPMHLVCESSCMRRPRPGAALESITLPTPDGTVTFAPTSGGTPKAPGPSTEPVPLPGYVDEEKQALIAENAELRSTLSMIQTAAEKANKR